MDDIVVGTVDDAICKEAAECGYEGIITNRDENDVLGRYVDIARDYGADVVVRITGDCPLIDSDVVDKTIRILKDDFACNIWPRTYPTGLDTEVMPVETLYRLENILDEGHPDREHVCVHVYGGDFVINSLVDDEDNSSQIWCVDYQEDFNRVARILGKWGDLGYKEILECMTN